MSTSTLLQLALDAPPLPHPPSLLERAESDAPRGEYMVTFTPKEEAAL